MRRLLTITFLTWLVLSACRPDEQIISDKEIRFSMKAVEVDAYKGGRTQSSIEPKAVLVTIINDDGQTVADRKELILYKFGNEFLSTPLTLKTTDNSNYRLSEFFVLDSAHVIRYATPREGSEFAHLVNDPLDITFTIDKDVITTVTPDVIAVGTNANPVQYGYGQFGFNKVKTINAIFSSFIKGANNFELTTSHLKIEGLRDSTSQDTTELWTYEKELEAKANILLIKEASTYRITAFKVGYKTWSRSLSLVQGSKVEILFEPTADTLDIYVAGKEQIGAYDVATYWKNGIPTRLSNIRSYAGQVFVSGGDVYVTGYESESLGKSNAFYWKNGQKVNLPQVGYTGSIIVKGNDVHILGTLNPTEFSFAPAYWKNGVLTSLQGTGKQPRVTASAMTLDGDDVYICGHEDDMTTTNKGESYPLIWKNGKLIELPLPSSYYKRTFTTSIKVKNGHVYVSGITNNDSTNSYMKPVYWKDNVMNDLPFTLANGYTNDMIVQDETVHIIGMEYTGTSASRAVYWKNGIVTDVLPQNSVYKQFYSITSMGTQIAIAGKYYGPRASYWLDGKQVTLGEMSSWATSIFLVKK